MNSRSKVPDDINELLRLVRAGKLFAIQEWIKAGNALRVADSDGTPSSVIRAAAGTGFHSLVEELLRAGGWSSSELADALETARSSKHFEVAALLEHHGAHPKPLDFQTSCENLDLFMMERHLRTGTDPNRDNVFAQTLSSVKARPLLGFYRQFRTEFPALDDQAALALAEAVKERQIRWTALLAWAGADPFRRVPNDLSESFPIDPENCTTAAKEAVWCSHPEILKALHLKPTPAQALELLSDATFFGNFKLFQNLLSIVPRDQINHTPRGSSQALENLVSRWAHRDLYNNIRDGKGDAENLQCLELLLDSGARWNPTPEELRHVRRNLLGHEGRYIVQVLRLLVYTPNAANIESFLELWMAEQLEPVRRRVALKIIKPGMDSKEVLVRFEQERQALALMEHPNIAKVLDAGVTPLGRPFFVMELVRGIRITDFCDQNNLPTAERLDLCQRAVKTGQGGADENRPL